MHRRSKQFLLTEFKNSTGKELTSKTANQSISDTIITYLNYGVFETRLSTKVMPNVLTGLVPSTILCSIFRPSSGVRAVSLKLLNARKEHGHDIRITLAET